MNKQQIVAQALISWLSDNLAIEHDIAREGLPQFDVVYFLEKLCYVENFSAKDFSIALVGFGVNGVELSELANKHGLGSLRGISDDLHVAAEWRNNRAEYGRILALAKGRHPGVHTLMHFAKARSKELAKAALQWAAEADDLFVMKDNQPQRHLLHELATNPELETLCSLEAITAFLAAWAEYRQAEPNDAPRKALSALGLFIDPQLLAGDNIAYRLLRNFELVDHIREMPAANLRDKRRRFARYQNVELRTKLLDILDRLETFRITTEPEAGLCLTYEEVTYIDRPPADTHEPQEHIEDEEEEEDTLSENDDEQQPQQKTFQETSTDALLDNRQETLEELADACEEAWEDFEEKQGNDIEVQFEFDEIQQRTRIPIDRNILEWLQTFCSEEICGGFFESGEVDLRLALSNHQNASPLIFFAPNQQVFTKEGQKVSMRQLFAAWDEDLAEAGFPSPDLLSRWDRFFALRAELVKYVKHLIYTPLEWLPGRQEIVRTIEHYLELSTQIYSIVQERVKDMANISGGWARATLEGLLSLDIIQVCIPLHDGRIAKKAVMLPTHPVHLWRYQRLVQILRGLGQSAELSDKDRRSIYADIRRPEHFLSIIYLGSLPDGLGINEILPVANDLNSMATFENLSNAYTGPDGAKKLAESVGYFATIGRYHARPLRVGLVNPPEPDTFMAEFIKLLNTPQFRQPESLPCLRVELFATPTHRGRIQAALRFDDRHRDLIEEKLASGRLQFRLHEVPQELTELEKYFRQHPFHILAIFDEASIHIRRRTAGRSLPMSPFCVRQQIRFEKRENLIRLEPRADDPLFDNFMQLINEAELGQRDSTPHAWADAERLRHTIDDLLQGEKPAAHWVFLADRALPTETGMQSVRLLRQRDGQRQTLLASRDYHRLTQLLRSAFARCNLSLGQKQLEQLLEEGANLVGGGLLDLIQKDGTPNKGDIVGFAGTLLTARDYRRNYPDCLVVSVDHEIARLWLRMGKRKNRTDLLVLYCGEDGFTIEAVEVKTTELAQLKERDERIEHAILQVEETLLALHEVFEAEETPLTAPRCEMLKEVLVHTCQSRIVSADLRSKWGRWLQTLFRQEQSHIPTVKLCGQVVKVLLSSNETGSDKLEKTSPYPIRIRTLTDLRVQELIEWQPGETPPDTLTPMSPLPECSQETLVSSEAKSTEILSEQEKRPIRPTQPAEHPSPSPVMPPTVSLRSPVRTLSSEDMIEEDLPWPPPVNALGMIGQQQAVQQLVDQANFARNYGEKFTDKLLVGPAGVGKSTLARRIAQLLLNEQEIFFNGADLRKPEMLLQKLEEAAKIPATSQQPIECERCLLFIDEVHGISTQVATALLSIMDDQRLTTISGISYDFRNVILILATTDPGKLSEAFNSRPDKTWLRPYTLHELAGIVWLHGKECLDNYELPQDVCYEIAARMRCNPRRAVRSLEKVLRPYFARKLNFAPLYEIGAGMTLEAVCEFYDEQGIDSNGLDNIAKNFLRYLYQNGATSEDRLRAGLGIANKNDFTEVDEYLQRLGLVEMTAGGRNLTREGRKYWSVGEFPLRDRISRQGV